MGIKKHPIEKIQSNRPHNYDVVIIGAGVAGTGLAYALAQEKYTGNILIIDKDRPGAAAGHSTRITFKKTIDTYKIPYVHRYKGFKIGAEKKVLWTIHKPAYLINYGAMCRSFLERSQAEFRKEEVVKVENSVVYTSGGIYHARYIIDCSGTAFFLRKKSVRSLPKRYWIGIVSVLKTRRRQKDEYVYYQFADAPGFVEEINPYGKTISHGCWQHTDTIDFSKIEHPKGLIKKEIVPHARTVQVARAVIPCYLTLPLYEKNRAFLGNSIGYATNLLVFGTTPILESAKMLAQALKQDDLRLYEKKWEQRFLHICLTYMAMRLDLYQKNRFITKLKNYPSYSTVIARFGKAKSFFYALMEDAACPLVVPSEIASLFPKRRKLFLIYYYMCLRLEVMRAKLSRMLDGGRYRW